LGGERKRDEVGDEVVVVVTIESETDLLVVVEQRVEEQEEFVELERWMNV
jgi:hypothetical protein